MMAGRIRPIQRIESSCCPGLGQTRARTSGIRILGVSLVSGLLI